MASRRFLIDSAVGSKKDKCKHPPEHIVKNSFGGKYCRICGNDIKDEIRNDKQNKLARTRQADTRDARGPSSIKG